MKKSFVQKGMYAVCTYDSNGYPQQLIKVRDKCTVTRASSIPMLTVVDNQLERPFVCKLPINEAEGGVFGVLGAGAATGTAYLLGYSIPPLALFALGGMAVYTIGKYFYASEVTSRQCNACINKSWIFPHEKVKIDQYKAILCHYSKLSCSKGGMIIASESMKEAYQLAQNIKKINDGEASLSRATNTVTGFIGGSSTSLIDLSLEIAFDVIDSLATGEEIEKEVGKAGTQAVSGGLTVAESVATEIVPDTLDELKKGAFNTNPQDIKKATKKGLANAIIHFASSESADFASEYQTENLMENIIQRYEIPQSSIVARKY